MREIKFRGKAEAIKNWEGYNKRYSVKDGDWVYGYYYKDVLDNEDTSSWLHVHYIRMKYGDIYADVEIDPETLGQFTGLKDKNGKEIYEGDIVKNTIVDEDSCMGNEFEYICEVCFGRSSSSTYRSEYPASFCLFNKEFYLDHKILDPNYGDFEVIGNIYENPELLTN